MVRLSARFKRVSLLWLRIGIGLAVLFWLYSALGSDALLQAWEKTDVLLFGVAILFQCLSYLLGAFRWLILLKGSGVDVPFFNAFSPYYLGLFFNQFLPTSVGGDAIRVYNLYKQGYSGEGLAASTMMDRLIGLIALLILASLAVIFSGENVVPEAVAAMVTIVLAAFASGTLLFFIFPFPDSLAARAEKIDPHTFLGRLFRVLRVCRAYKGSSLLLLSSLFLSFILQGLMILVYVILARALDLDISLTMLLIAVPLVFVATALPLTIGGLGVREGVLVFMLGLFGIGIVPSGQLASVYLIVLWLSVIPGGWPFIFKRSIKNHGQ